MTAVEKKQRKGMQGFASLPAEQRSQIARMGGQAAHAQGRAHKWTSKEAQAAGRKSRRGPSRKESA